jgi:putative transposase
MRYRRAHVPGATYFFTVVTARRRPILAGEAAVAALREALRAVMAGHPFHIDALVVLPDHLHTLWTLPEGDADYPTRWMLVKTRVTRALRAGDVKGPVWQARYWEHLIRDEADFAAHADYIHYNPVRHGHARSPAEWPWSSFKRWVETGRYPADWGGSGIVLPEGVGRE